MYRNVEKLITSVQLRPKMYIAEIRIDYLYHFLLGRISAVMRTDLIEDIDLVFKRNFSRWTEEWMLEKFGKKNMMNYFGINGFKKLLRRTKKLWNCFLKPVKNFSMTIIKIIQIYSFF
ncbi:hypothetical protein LI951_09875 [Enterococcus sp. BWT-B8]|uniref:hypothetical protein n=1 Tax=Enterococcus sp. BWT-B8 TaxID=2885157 RepID=UPI001E3BCD84|nr:hypothetical protein [Enterococcus sp. BWT-B8]MCB5952372.1 hypothetical protein [Enterococcus sp. BWT-B8]